MPTPAVPSSLTWGSYDPNRIHPPTWLIEDLIPEHATAVLYGGSNIGKSFIALDWALAVATGLPSLGGFKKSKAEVGRDKAPGKVLTGVQI